MKLASLPLFTHTKKAQGIALGFLFGSLWFGVLCSAERQANHLQ